MATRAKAGGKCPAPDQAAIPETTDRKGAEQASHVSGAQSGARGDAGDSGVETALVHEDVPVDRAVTDDEINLARVAMARAVKHAREAYEFTANSYTWDAMVNCLAARDALAGLNTPALAESVVQFQPDKDAPGLWIGFKTAKQRDLAMRLFKVEASNE